MKVKVIVSLWNSVGADDEKTIEIPDEDLEDLDGHDRERVIEEYCWEEVQNMISWNWEEV